MMTIQSQWEFFEKMVLPSGAPPVQRQEMRRAFYAGCDAILRMQWELGGEDVSEAAGAAIIQGWNNEMEQFALAIAAGKA